jgi:hypothetical protein
MDLPRGGGNSSSMGTRMRSLMGGWTSAGAKNGYWSVFCKDSYSGQIVYCIEPGMCTARPVISKGPYDEDFWDNYPSGLNPTISPTVIKAYIGRIMQYGWQGNGEYRPERFQFVRRKLTSRRRSRHSFSCGKPLSASATVSSIMSGVRLRARTMSSR